jgi:adenylate cyclase
VGTISAQELAELVPCSLAEVRRLEAIGILEPHRKDGQFEPAAVYMVRLMGAFEEAGISPEDVERALATGGVTFPLGRFFPDPVALTGTYGELAARLGRTPELLRRLSRELGLPPPADDRLRAEDAEILSLFLTKLDLAEEEELSRIARLYGGTLQRLVGSAVQFFDVVVRKRVEAREDLTLAQQDALLNAKGAGFTEFVSALVPWLQRRHREHALLEYIVSVTEEFMEQQGLTPPQPKQPPAIAFLDLTGCAALAEERGDEAAAELAAGLAGIVEEAAREHGGRAVKWLGDGVMFHFADPGRAILGGLDLVEQTELTIRMPARIGINAGAVIAQEGDYFGRTVNIAARIADYARPHEVLVSEDARQSAGAADVAFEPVGDVPLKGVSKPVLLHRVRRPS